MADDAFRILAQHFAEKDNIRVVLEGEEAKANIEDGTIFLPESVPDHMFGVTLATLLHESGHMKSTQAVAVQQGSPLFYVINTLEDIRIDKKIMDKYPNAKGLYADLMNYYTEKYGSDYSKLPKEVRILRDLILKSYKTPELFEQYRDQSPEVKKFMDDNAIRLDAVIEAAQGKKKTQELDMVAKNLMEMLFPGEDAKLKMKRSQVSNDLNQATKDMGEQYKEYSEQSQIERNIDQLDKQEEQQAQNEENNAQTLENQSKAYQKMADRFEQDAKKMKDAGRKVSGDKFDKCADEAKKKLEEFKKKAQEARDKANRHRQKAQEVKANKGQVKADAQAKASAASKAYNASQHKVQALQQAMAGLQQGFTPEMQQAFDGYDKIGIKFDRIDKKDFKENYVFKQTLEERLMEFLRNKFDRKVVCDDGKISPLKLPTYYNPDTLFEQKVDDAHRKTRVYFMVDASGSMGAALSCGSGKARYEVCTDALMNICKVIEKGINDYGMDIEYAIYSFEYSATLLKDFEKQLDRNKVAGGLRPGGGTNPMSVIQEIEKIEPNDIHTKEIVFFITDGGFGPEDYHYIKQQMGQKKTWVFIGVDVFNEPEAQKMFGEFNICNDKDTQKMITKAIEANM